MSLGNLLESLTQGFTTGMRDRCHQIAKSGSWEGLGKVRGGCPDLSLQRLYGHPGFQESAHTEPPYRASMPLPRATSDSLRSALPPKPWHLTSPHSRETVKPSRSQNRQIHHLQFRWRWRSLGRGCPRTRELVLGSSNPMVCR